MTPESLNDSDLLEHIAQLRARATDAYHQGEQEGMEVWTQAVNHFSAEAKRRELI
ncbi:hypothetical protein [Rhodococcus qingshengii]|uniref:hypothetical protein n=1 Tax=Rhodococcus qingshengii TaxID=334542 RepID=UPI001ADFB36A|nr:hypothetical protein [Rhodococcus qingshengii]